MLRELIQAWRGKDLLSRMLVEFQDMLARTEWMFGAVSDVLLRKRKPAELQEEIYRTDKDVNEAERRIRRQIVEHLSVRPDADVPAALVLMSIVKDAERVGDYCKNIFEVACMYTMDMNHGRYIGPFQETRSRIAELFVRVRNAFARSDEAEARQVIADAETLAGWCDDRINDFFHDTLTTQQAVAYTLLARYFKRIASHLKNVASAIVSTVEELDYPMGPQHKRKQGKAPE